MDQQHRLYIISLFWVSNSNSIQHNSWDKVAVIATFQVTSLAILVISQILLLLLVRRQLLYQHFSKVKLLYLLRYYTQIGMNKSLQHQQISPQPLHITTPSQLQLLQERISVQSLMLILAAKRITSTKQTGNRILQ